VLLDIAKALQAALLFIPSVRALTTFSRKNSGYVFIIHQNNMLVQYIVSYKQMIAIEPVPEPFCDESNQNYRNSDAPNTSDS
jgi:hypothetical protein